MNKYYLCKTQEEYDWLMKKLEKEGFKWRSGTNPTEEDSYENHGDKTVVKESRNLTFASTDFFLDNCGLKQSDFISVSELMKEEKEKQSRQVVYLVQKTSLINKGVKTTDGVFRTFQAAEKHILDQGGRPLGFFCYESTELGFEIEQFEVLEVEE